MDAKLQEKVDKLMDELEKYLNRIEKNPERPLYHYTNYAGLLGILESKCLWLTEHKYLNDPSEIEHGKKIILNSLTRRYQNYHNLIIYLTYNLNLVKEKSYKTYITSFCEEPDYLPAWRYYGDNGAGFSIGFKKEYFYPSQNTVEPRDATFLLKVEYDESVYSDTIDNILSTADVTFTNWFKIEDPSQIRPYISALFSSLFTTLPEVKNIDYQDEKEWRSCMIRLYNETNNTWHPAPLPIERLIISKIDNRNISPFVKNVRTMIPRIESLKFDYSDISDIHIGPRLDFLTAKLAIEKHLNNIGVSEDEIQNINILPSERAFQ